MSDKEAPSAEVLPAQRRVVILGEGRLRLAAPAKINLNLLVGPRRPDGYHDLDSVVAKVTLYDRIELARRSDGRIALHCEGEDCGPAEENLAVRAGRLLAAQACGAAAQGADIDLHKAIPPGKGLGGGSSDAAAVLEGLNRLWATNLPAERLVELAARLGSDVPLFLGPPAARMTGRGDLLAPARVHPFVAVLHIPAIDCPTAAVYEAYDRSPYGTMGGQLDPDLLAGEPPSRWRGLLVNQLAPAAITVRAELASLRERLSAAVGLPVCVTGSGSALFILCDDAAEAGRVLSRFPPGLDGRTVLAAPNPW